MRKEQKNPKLNNKVSFGLSGHLTIFLSLSLTVLLGLFLFLIEASFVNFSKMKAECVTDIGMNSILGEYHREMLAQYDLLFVDISYGTAAGSTKAVENHLSGFINKNLSGDFSGDLRTLPAGVSSWNELELSHASITATLRAHHYEGKVLKQQACAYISENAKAAALSDLTSLAGQATSLDEKDEMASWQNTMGTITTLLAAMTNDARQEAMEDDPEADVEQISISIDNPAADAFDEAKAWVAAADSGSGNIRLGDYYSHRESSTTSASGYEESLAVKAANELLFNQYLFEKMGYHMNPKPDSRLTYQIEYILCGANSDEKNMRGVKLRIFSWRMADNVRLYMSDKQKRAEARTIALLATTLLLRPELTEAVTYAILFSWAFYDTKTDVDEILDGGKVPLVKKSIGSTENGLSYQQYLGLMLVIQRERITIARAMDIMEMDIRLTPGNQYFRIDQCLESLRVTAVYHDRYGSYEIDRRYGYY